MNRTIVALGAACAAVAAGVTLLTLTRTEREAPADPRVETAASSEPRTTAPDIRAAPSAPLAAAARAGRRAAPAPIASPVAAPPEAATEAGTLRIDADVPGAQVFIDRRFIGTAPVTAENLTPGTHQLNVSAEGFEGIARTIDVEPGPRDLTVRFREVRLDASVAVVHRHRMGSCTGQLVATPDGLRYETSNREDGFTVPLADLETFGVDYQDRNLRVKVRKGREYNFTDPDGNADRLFVFHRDVDRARQRLASGDAPAGH